MFTKKDYLIFALAILAMGLLSLLFFSIANAEEQEHSWKWYNTLAEVTYEGLQYADLKTTREFTGNPQEYPRFYETNPILGMHPSARRVNLYMFGTMIVHPIISYFLVTSKYEIVHDIGIAFQTVSIYVEYDAVSHNVESGVTLKFF